MTNTAFDTEIKLLSQHIPSLRQLRRKGKSGTGVLPRLLCFQSLSSYIYGIDNYNSGYLGMAAQFYIQANLGHYHILTQKGYHQKLMAQLKSTPHFTNIRII